MLRIIRVIFLIGLLAILPLTLAQDDQGEAETTTASLLSPLDLAPASYELQGVRHEYQAWNNCGPATLTMGLTFFGYEQDQNPAALWLKPNPEDKNVSPWQMLAFVNTQVPGTTRALKRYGGDLQMLKTLISNDFPVLIEAGYDPVSASQGWMGHYLLIKGYNDGTQQMITHDSFDGPNLAYPYAEIEDKWSHFNNVYIVLYDFSREDDLMALLGDDADENQNVRNALVKAQDMARMDGTNPFAWFNIGSSYVMLAEYHTRTGNAEGALENYTLAAGAFDYARANGLPWRMLWYQFGPFEAYNAVGRYQDSIDLAQSNLNDGGGQYVEETFYYAGVAREGLGELDRALTNYNTAIQFNPNFTPAVEARERLLAVMNS